MNCQSARNPSGTPTGSPCRCLYYEANDHESQTGSTPKSPRVAPPCPPLPCPLLRNSAQQLDPKEKSQEREAKKCIDLCVNNAIKKRVKKRKRERKPKSEKGQKCCVIPPKHQKPRSPKPRRDTGSPERIAPADSRTNTNPKHGNERKKSPRFARKKIKGASHSLLKTGRASPAPASRRGGTRSIATRG